MQFALPPIFKNKNVNLWLIFLVGMILYVGLNDAHRSVLHHYVGAAQDWVHGRNMYLNTGRGFLYFPQCAIFFIPISILPRLSGELLWRSISIIVYIYAMYRWLALSKYFSSRFFFYVSLLAIPIIFSSCRNGQANLILAALMMLSIVCTVEKKWWLAAFFIVFGFMIKPTMVVLLLLLVVLYRPLWWRVLLFIAFFMLMPFLFQSTDYVIAQYKDCITMLHAASAMGDERNTWAQAFGMFGLLGHPFSPLTQNIVRIIMAVATLGLCCYAKSKMTITDFALFLFAIAASYLMLFNPRTENNDYAIVAPALAYAFSVYYINRKKLLTIIMGVVLVGVMFGHFIGTVLTGYGTWTAPLMVDIFFIILVISVFHYKKDALFAN